MIQAKHLALILGGTLLSIGLLIGFLPVKQSGIGCGSAFTGQSDNAKVSDLTNAMMGRLRSVDTQCQDALSSRRVPALALTLPGLGLVLAGAGLSMDTQALAKRKGAHSGTA